MMLNRRRIRIGALSLAAAIGVGHAPTTRAQCFEYEEATPRTSNDLGEASNGFYQIVYWGGDHLDTITLWGEAVADPGNQLVTVQLYEYPYDVPNPANLYSSPVGGSVSETRGDVLYSNTVTANFQTGSYSCVDSAGLVDYHATSNPPPAHANTECPPPTGQFYGGGPCCYSFDFPTFYCCADMQWAAPRTTITVSPNTALQAGYYLLYTEGLFIAEGGENLTDDGAAFDDAGNRFNAGQWDLGFALSGTGPSDANTLCSTTTVSNPLFLDTPAPGHVVSTQFSNVTAEGNTSITMSTACTDFAIGSVLSSLFCYEISTTAAWSGTTRVCIRYPTFTNEAFLETKMVIRHKVGTTWSTLTNISRNINGDPNLADNADGGQICGDTTSFSPFGLDIGMEDLCADATTVELGPVDCPADVNVFYAVVTDDASGEILGTGRCTETAGVVECDRDDDDASRMKIYPELMCALP